MKRIARSVMSSTVALGAVIVALVFPCVAAAQSDPAVGTWKLNASRSKYDPGPTPMSNLITITAASDGIKVSAKGTDGEGKPTSVEYTASYDGKDSAVKGASAYETTSMKRVDANTTEFTRKKDGKVVQMAKRVISNGGKTMTITSTGTDEKGRKIQNVAVYDKQ